MSDGKIKNNKIFWLDIDSIEPNPYQPRKEFNQAALQDLSDSIKQYGILQPLTVTEEGTLPDGRTRYELIAGERRLRASKLAKLERVPAVVRQGDNNEERLELAIIENLQREDLNAIERAKAFLRLAQEFDMTHAQIAKKMGRSRTFVSNTLRLLSLPDEIQTGLWEGRISEGHTRPLMMLSDKPEEQMVLFKEIMYRKMSVRESEKVARKIAHEKVRKAKHKADPKIRSFEKQFSDTLGTRVSIEEKEVGGKLVIDYFSEDDLDEILEALQKAHSAASPHEMLERFVAQKRATADALTLENEEPQLKEPMIEDAATPEISYNEDRDEIGTLEEDSDIDDIELDIVADPSQDIPEEYLSVFKIAPNPPSPTVAQKFIESPEAHAELSHDHVLSGFSI